VGQEIPQHLTYRQCGGFFGHVFRTVCLIDQALFSLAKIKTYILALLTKIYSIIKKTIIAEAIRLHSLCWFGHVQGIEENSIAKRVLYMYLETTRLRG
jgi:hypothetical protein